MILLTADLSSGRRVDCERSGRIFFGVNGYVYNGGGAFTDLVRAPFADAMLLAVPEAPLALLAGAGDSLSDAYRHAYRGGFR